MLLAPSILSANFAKLGEDVEKIAKAGCDYIHIDVMDGFFVPNITFGPPVIKAIRPYTDKVFDVHLMIEEPIRYLQAFADSGADILTVHAEGAKHLHRVIHAIKDLGLKAGVSINPATPCSILEPILPDLDLVLIMSVNPGFGGQSFIPSSLKKIAQTRRMIGECQGHALIEVDGGITLDNAKAVLDAGADVLVAGSSVFNAKDVSAQIALFKQIG